jgi:hypothetical protein
LDAEAGFVAEAGDQSLDFGEEGVRVVVQDQIFLVVGCEGDKSRCEMFLALLVVLAPDFLGKLLYKFLLPPDSSFIFLINFHPLRLALSKSIVASSLFDPYFEPFKIVLANSEFFGELLIVKFLLVEVKRLSFVVFYHFQVVDTYVFGLFQSAKVEFKLALKLGFGYAGRDLLYD